MSFVGSCWVGSWALSCLWLFIWNELQNWANSFNDIIAKTIIRTELNMILNFYYLGNLIFHIIYMNKLFRGIRMEFLKCFWSCNNSLIKSHFFHVKMDYSPAEPCSLVRQLMQILFNLWRIRNSSIYVFHCSYTICDCLYIF